MVVGHHLLLCLQETKALVFSDVIYFSLWGNNNVGWLHNTGLNGAGSLLIAWNKGAFIYENHV